MIYCKKRKIGIFLNPRTGTTSLYHIFKSIDVDQNKHVHVNYSLANDAYDIPDFHTYKFFCFYRNPIDRFVSCFKYFKRKAHLGALSQFSGQEAFLKATADIKMKKYELFYPMNKGHKDEYHWLCDEHKQIIESITIDQILNLLPDNPGDINFNLPVSQGIMTSLFSSQKNWLDFDIDITYLNFENYENEVRNLTAMFDVTLENVMHGNQSLNLSSDVPPTPQEILNIKQKYSGDYDFFASKGITFP